MVSGADGGQAYGPAMDIPDVIHGAPGFVGTLGARVLSTQPMLLRVFGDLVEAGAVPLAKKAEIEYVALATGPLLAAATLVGDEAGARKSLAVRGRASDPVQASVGTYVMSLLQGTRRRPDGRSRRAATGSAAAARS